MKTTFLYNIYYKREVKYKTILPEPPWSSLPQHKKEKKFMDVLTNGYPNYPDIDHEYQSFQIGETHEQAIQRKILAETPTERIIRLKKHKVKSYDVFRKGYSNV